MWVGGSGFIRIENILKTTLTRAVLRTARVVNSSRLGAVFTKLVACIQPNRAVIVIVVVCIGISLHMVFTT